MHRLRRLAAAPAGLALFAVCKLKMPRHQEPERAPRIWVRTAPLQREVWGKPEQQQKAQKPNGAYL